MISLRNPERSRFLGLAKAVGGSGHNGAITLPAS
jgi:hypothetical protein